jgi:hypothetical protein
MFCNASTTIVSPRLRLSLAGRSVAALLEFRIEGRFANTDPSEEPAKKSQDSPDNLHGPHWTIRPSGSTEVPHPASDQRGRDQRRAHCLALQPSARLHVGGRPTRNHLRSSRPQLGRLRVGCPLTPASSAPRLIRWVNRCQALQSGLWSSQPPEVPARASRDYPHTCSARASRCQKRSLRQALTKLRTSSAVSSGRQPSSRSSNTPAFFSSGRAAST